MDLPTLVYRRTRGDVIEAYKYLHGLYRTSCDDLLPLARSDTQITTRGHCLKLLKRDCKTRLRANVFGYRIVNLWNTLPQDIVTASSVNAFKGKFDRHCFSSRYEMDK